MSNFRSKFQLTYMHTESDCITGGADKKANVIQLFGSRSVSRSCSEYASRCIVNSLTTLDDNNWSAHNNTTPANHRLGNITKPHFALIGSQSDLSMQILCKHRRAFGQRRHKAGELLMRFYTNLNTRTYKCRHGHIFELKDHKTGYITRGPCPVDIRPVWWGQCIAHSTKEERWAVDHRAKLTLLGKSSISSSGEYNIDLNQSKCIAYTCLHFASKQVRWRSITVYRIIRYVATIVVPAAMKK